MEGPPFDRPDGYLMRFVDGRMSQIGNVRTVESMVLLRPVAPGNFTVPRDLFGWPLPERLCTLCHPGLGENAAVWSEGDPGELPEEIVTSPNVEMYVKVGERPAGMKADEYIFFEDVPTDTERVTRIVAVRNRRSGDQLGMIRWHGPWRQYCFFPMNMSIYNPTCLARINEEMLAMTSAHRATP